MKLCQFYASSETRAIDLRRRWPAEARLGVVDGEQIVNVTDAFGPPDLDGPTPNAAVALLISGLDPKDLAGPSFDAASVFLAPPVLRPAHFMDFYAFEQHVKAGRARRGLEMEPTWYEIPAYYNTTPHSFYGDGETVLYPPGEERMDFELELACVVGSTIRNASQAEAAAAIAGYTILNDCSARARQQLAMKIGLGPSPGKDFGSAIGPWLVSVDEVPDYTTLGMRAFVNDELWSDGVAGAMQHSFEDMIVYASRSRTLFPGDVIGSGTVGGGCGLELDRYLASGDSVRLEIDGLGSLTVGVDQE